MIITPTIAKNPAKITVLNLLNFIMSSILRKK